MPRKDFNEIFPHGTISGPAAFSDIRQILNEMNEAGYFDGAGEGEIPSELERIEYSSKYGWRLLGEDPSTHVELGDRAIDLTSKNESGALYGAGGELSFTLGKNNIALNEEEFVSGLGNLGALKRGVAINTSNALAQGGFASSVQISSGTFTFNEEDYSRCSVTFDVGDSVATLVFNGEKDANLQEFFIRFGTVTNVRFDEEASLYFIDTTIDLSDVPIVLTPNLLNITKSLENENWSFNGFVGGERSIVTGDSAFAYGVNNLSSGFCSFALGYKNFALDDNTFTLGSNLIAQWGNQIILGSYNEGSNKNNILELGIGVSSKKNGLEITWDGEIYAPELSTGLIDEASSDRILVTKEWVQANGGSTEIALSDLTDTSVDRVLDQQIIRWSADLQKWVSSDETGMLVAVDKGYGLRDRNSDNQALPGENAIDFVKAERVYDTVSAGASGMGSLAFGGWDADNGTWYGSEASGICSIAGGGCAYGTGPVASGDYSQAFGHSTEASGNMSTVFGYNSKATSDYAFACGRNTKAENTAAHAEGSSALASGFASHAEGGETIASESYAHAEGSSTQALGAAAHAEGQLTEARASSSHAEGLGTIAQNTAQHSCGQYNIGTSTETILEVGVGPTSSDRRNGFEVYFEGTSTLPESDPSAITNRGVKAIPTIEWLLSPEFGNSLPTTDPGVPGQLWNDAGVVKVSQ